MESKTSELQKRLEREIATLRRSGVIPPSLEATMARAINDLKPRLRFDSIRERLFNLEATSYVDVAVPTDSNKPGVSIIKRAIKSGVGWYLTYLTQQVNNFNFEVVGLLNVLELRLADQEARLDRIEPGASLMKSSVNFPPNALVSDAVFDQFVAYTGELPILVASAEEDQLLARLTSVLPERAYGQIEDPVSADAAGAQGLEIHNSSLLWHLEHCADSSLGGIVLRGSELECSPIWLKRSMLSEIHRVLAPEALAILVHHEPSILTTSPGLRATAAIRGEPISARAWSLLATSAGWGFTTQWIDVDTAVTRLTR